MTDMEQLRALVKQLHASSSPEEIRDVLQTMKKEARITESVLRESKAGLAVGKLRTHATKEVADLAKELVKQWKADVERDKAARGDAGKGTKDSGAKKSTSKASTPAPATPTTPTATVKALALPTPAPRAPAPAAASASVPKKPAAATAAAAAGNSAVRTMKSDGVSAVHTGDTVRDKCVDLLYGSLAIDTAAPSDLILKRALAIEAAVLSTYGSTSAEYKSRIRQLFVNLRDPKNPGLREAVVSGDTPAATFAGMSSADMASEERKAADRKIEADNLFGALAAHEQQAETDAFQCGRCKQRKCRYRQAQTRSADEPMTTFVTCTHCGHKWKFS